MTVSEVRTVYFKLSTKLDLSVQRKYLYEDITDLSEIFANKQVEGLILAIIQSIIITQLNETPLMVEFAKFSKIILSLASLDLT